VTQLLLWAAAIPAALFALHRLFLWMEARDWIYYRRKPRGGGLGDVFLNANVLDPGRQHIIEAREELISEERGAGDDDADRDEADRYAPRVVEPDP
jgi:hypothetical protein